LLKFFINFQTKNILIHQFSNKKTHIDSSIFKQKIHQFINFQTKNISIHQFSNQKYIDSSIFKPKIYKYINFQTKNTSIHQFSNQKYINQLIILLVKDHKKQAFDSIAGNTVVPYRSIKKFFNYHIYYNKAPVYCHL